MRRDRFGDERIIGILKEQEAGQKTADLYPGISLSNARSAAASRRRWCSCSNSLSRLA